MAGRASRMVGGVALLLVGLCADLGASAAMAAEPEGVHFLDPSDATVKTDESSSVKVDVINGGSLTQVVEARIIGLPGTAPAPTASARLAVGEVGTLEIPLPAGLGPGPHVATMAVYGLSDGTSDSRKLTVTVPVDTPSPVPSGLIDPFPEELTWQVDLARFSPLSEFFIPVLNITTGFGNESMGPVNIPLGASGVQDGRLADSHGNVASATVSGEMLTITDLVRAGEFTGRLKTGSGDDDVIGVTIKARDGWLYPLIALILGLFAAAKIDRHLTYSRPWTRLVANLETLRSTATTAEQGQQDWLAENGELLAALPEPGRYSYRVTGSARPAGSLPDPVLAPAPLLDTEIKRAKTEFEGTGSPEDRMKRWAIDGEGFTPLRSLVTSLESIYIPARKLGADWLEQRNIVDDAAWFETTETSRIVVGALAGRVIGTTDDLKNLGASLGSAGTLLEKFRFAYQELKRLDALPGPPDPGPAPGRPKQSKDKVIETLRDDLRGATGDRIDKVRDKILETADQWKAAANLAPTERVAPIGGSIWPALTSATQLIEPGTSPAAAKRTELWFQLGTGALVVAAGLAGYLSNPTFGSMGDYLAIVTFGTAAKSGLELLRRLPVISG